MHFNVNWALSNSGLRMAMTARGPWEAIPLVPTVPSYRSVLEDGERDQSPLVTAESLGRHAAPAVWKGSHPRGVLNEVGLCP